MSASSTRSRPGWWPTSPGSTPLLPDADQIAYLDVDDTIRATYGYAKQGAGYGYSGVKGLNALLAALSTPALGAGDRGDPAAEGLGQLRPRRRPAGRRRAGHQPRRCGASGLLVVRADSAFYGRDVIAAIGRAEARFSITARQDVAVHRGDRRHPARTPGPRSATRDAVFDDQLGQWVSDAEVAEIAVHRVRLPRQEARQVTARLIVRRVRDHNPDHAVRRRAGRAVPGLAPPRRVHRLAAADAAGRGRSPPATPSSNRSSPT